MHGEKWTGDNRSEHNWTTGKSYHLCLKKFLPGRNYIQSDKAMRKKFADTRIFPVSSPLIIMIIV